jgi:hypothetical protein
MKLARSVKLALPVLRQHREAGDVCSERQSADNDHPRGLRLAAPEESPEHLGPDPDGEADLKVTAEKGRPRFGGGGATHGGEGESVDEGVGQHVERVGEGRRSRQQSGGKLRSEHDRVDCEKSEEQPPLAGAGVLDLASTVAHGLIPARNGHGYGEPLPPA